MLLNARFDREWVLPRADIATLVADPTYWPLASFSFQDWPLHGWLISRHTTPDAFEWVARHPLSKRWCVCTLRLFPAGTSTHCRFTITIDDPSITDGLGGWIQRRRWLRALGAHFRPSTTVAERPAVGPATQAAFAAMGCLDTLERIRQLDTRWQSFERGDVPPSPHAVVETLPPVDLDVDLVYAGGGLGLLHAALMAQRGYRVAVFDRHEVGCAHREWNSSIHELEALVSTGLIDWETLNREIIMSRYDDGVVRFHAVGSDVPADEMHLPDVLNVALDAGALLRHVRAVFEAAGGIIWEGWQFERVVAAPQAQRVAVAVQGATEQRWIGARLLVDGMGATSPLTLAAYPFQGICPTVGTVVRGVRHDPTLGDILVSVASAQAGRQLIWEGFPGRDGELTVYVFFYDQVAENAQFRHSLLDLFEDYFTLLPSYKAALPDFAHLRPVFGYIPARHSVHPPTPLLGTIAVGDASAQQSPLTFCGFGSFIRNLQRTVDGLDEALALDLWRPSDLRAISAFQSNVSMNWVFSRFMAPWESPQDVNELQNVFAMVLNRLGPDITRRFFQDQMTWSDYRALIIGTLRIYPAIMGIAWRVLRWHGVRRWVADWLRFSWSAAVAAMAAPILEPLETMIRPYWPRWAFHLRRRRAEWIAMGWHQSRQGDIT